MIPSRKNLLTLGLLTTAGLVWTLSGCSETPVSRESSSSPASILRRTSRSKPAEGTDTIEDSIAVRNGQGGMVLVGDAAIGNSSLDVPDDAVDDPVTVQLVKMKVNRIGDVSAELRPQGLRFKKAVMIVLSYKGADLTGIDETKLRIYYFNEGTGAWELVPGSVPYPDRDIVTAPLWHFSQYAIGGNG